MSTGTFAASRPRAWVGRVIVLSLVALLAVAAATVASRSHRWPMQLAGVRFVDHPEKVVGGDAALVVTGYVIATVVSDVDVFRLAREDAAYPQVQGTLCDSGKSVGAWRDPLPIDSHPTDARFAYAVLVPARSNGVDLSQASEDVCLRFVAADSAALAAIGSQTVKLTLAPELRERLLAYGRREGVVDLVLDPACAPQLCQPDFSSHGLHR